MSNHVLLYEVAVAYVHSRERFNRYSGAGDAKRADQAFAEMQSIERSIGIVEHSKEWRNVRREAADE
jgi:hypothetical protein